MAHIAQSIGLQRSTERILEVTTLMSQGSWLARALYRHREQDNEDNAAIAANVSTQDVEGQLRWLDQELDRSSAPWKLVIGHHTLHSGGSQHGDTPEMVQLVEPLLQKHGVQAYINGHDHDLQHIRRGGVNYIGSGAGSEVRPVAAIEGTRFCASISGFAAISLHPEMLDLRFRDFTGADIYRVKIAGPTSQLSKAAQLGMTHIAMAAEA